MDNREKILTSALDLFYARGYDAVGIQQIVDAAGLTKPTMYYYFGSKRGLLDALLGEQYEKLERCIDQYTVLCWPCFIRGRRTKGIRRWNP